MLFNSIEFLLFFPAVVLLYYAIPGKLRVFWILLTSYLFYMNWNPAYALLLLFSTAVTFLFGLLIGKRRTKEKAAAEAGRPIRQLSKVWVGVSFAVNLAILFFYKYFDFTVDNLNVIRGWMGLAPVTPGFDVLLPVGISFYIFQALSYVVDVYRGDVRMETNFIKYAAFVSFFPQLVAGPIERSTNLLTQFDTPHKLEYDNVRDGLLRMVWGFFLKIVIADRAAILVNQVFNYCNYYEGPTVLIAAVLFAFQVYGDFAGYSNIAIGAAQVMGFKLMKNFERPYLAVPVSDFWRRWHISLSTWFRDYLYIPLGGNRKGTVRKYINQMIVIPSPCRTRRQWTDGAQVHQPDDCHARVGLVARRGVELRHLGWHQWAVSGGGRYHEALPPPHPAENRRAHEDAELAHRAGADDVCAD